MEKIDKVEGNALALMSYWEHFKRAKELALVFPPDNPQRLKIEAEMASIQKQLNSSTQQTNN